MTSSPYPHSDRDLLNRIQRSAGNKAGYKQLIRELGLGGGRERRLLVEQLTRLVARGELQQLESGLWALPRPVTEESSEGGDRASGPTIARAVQDSHRRSGRDRLLSGKLALHRDGFGFVRLDALPAAHDREPQDIFIPPTALHGAMHGDLVLVEEDTPRFDGRRSGRIARVLTRRNPTLVGIFHYARTAGRHWRGETTRGLPIPSGDFVQPLDDRHGGPIEIPELPESPLPTISPHRTLGDEARPFAATDDAETADPRWPLEGLAVEVEILHYAQAGRAARGRILEILGPPDAFGVDVEIVIRKHGIPHTFPAHVLEEAARQSERGPATLTAEELSRREDFRHLSVVTIDGETARDFDDAVLVRSLPNGHSELQVHIADVGWYVQAGSPLDTEARVRGTSVYFPDRAVPMLPHALSSGMCSLLPHEDRLVQSCIMEIDERGEIVAYRVAEGLIRSARRMTYTAVQHCLNASPAAAAWNAHRQITPTPSAEDLLERERLTVDGPSEAELPKAFDHMLELALRLNAKRVRRGSIDFDLPEPVVQFDPDGNMKAIVRSERGWAHRLIEEFMLSANECVATWLTAQTIPSLYRIHEMPSPKRVMEFEEVAAGFGQTLGIGSLPVKRLALKGDRREAQRRSARGRGQPAGRSAPPAARELPASIPVTPQMYQKLVRRIAGTPEERILAYLMLRSLKQARYAEQNEGHFALASPCYTHFTSPIRRYPDLIVHRLLRTMLHRGADPRGGPILSGDPQPWATELARSRGQHAFQAGAAQTAKAAGTSPHAALAPPVPLAGGRARKKRPGRIGWSGGDETSAVRFGTETGDSSQNAAADSGYPMDHPSVSAPKADRGAEPGDRAERSSGAVPGSGADPIAAPELTDIAVESSQAERRAADAERELMEWKKIKFMADRVGDHFEGIILSVTKFGFFVELDELFIEGLVPLSSLVGDFYSYRDGDRTICGARTGHCFAAGQRVAVLLDRIDRQQRRLQFALQPGTEPRAEGASLRGGRDEGLRETKKARAAAKREKKSKSGKKASAGASPSVQARNDQGAPAGTRKPKPKAGGKVRKTSRKKT